MSNGLITYDPSLTSILFGGIELIDTDLEGYVDIVYPDAGFMHQAGRNQSTRSKSTDRSAVATVHVLENSTTEYNLTNIFNGDYLSRNGSGILEFTVSQTTTLNRGSQIVSVTRNLCTAAESYIKQLPNRSIGNKNGINDWVIQLNCVSNLIAST